MKRYANRNPKYLNWIRTLPCLICERQGKHQTSRTEAHHAGEHGYGRKAADSTAIPLCGVEHHREGRQAVHVIGKRFGVVHGIDVTEEMVRLNREYADGAA